MSQSRRQSVFESIANVVLGWLVAIATQLLVFPAVGLQVTLAQHLGISAVLTCVSLLRNHALRRVFNALAGPA